MLAFFKTVFNHKSLRTTLKRRLGLEEAAWEIVQTVKTVLFFLSFSQNMQ